MRAIRAGALDATIEILTPDFLRKPIAAALTVIDSGPDVFNHNLETVPRLYPSIRPGARYYGSLRLLERVKERAPAMFTKSGLMVGLGEDFDEMVDTFRVLREHKVQILTVGQYLRPTEKHLPVVRYWEPAEFDRLRDAAYELGFESVASGPLVRSSYHADEAAAEVAQRRAA